MLPILEEVFARLDAEVPELRFIDLDIGQLQMESPPVDFPCALVDISDVDYSSSGRGLQTAISTVTVSIGFQVLAPSDTRAPEDQRMLALDHYRIVSKVAAALHGYGTDLFTPLCRVALRRQSSTYPRHFTLTFRTQSQERIA